MPEDGLPKKLLFGQVKGRCPPGCPRSSFSDVAVRDCQLHCITEPYKGAQNRLLWRDKTCLAPGSHQLESVIIIVSIVLMAQTSGLGHSALWA